MNSFLENILNHGYITVFLFVLAEQIGIPLPAGLILLGAGALAGLHRMSFGIVIVVAVTASLIADSIWFYLGWRRGATILAFIYRVTPRCRISPSRMNSLLKKYGPSFLLVSKFVPGLGMLVPPITGAMKVEVWYFLLLDAGGALAISRRVVVGQRAPEMLLCVCRSRKVLFDVIDGSAVEANISNKKIESGTERASWWRFCEKEIALWRSST